MSKKIRIPKFPEVPRDANGREPLLYAKIEALKGLNVLYLKSAALENVISNVCEVESSYFEPGGFGVVPIEGATRDNLEVIKYTESDEGIDIQPFATPPYWTHDAYMLWNAPEHRELSSVRWDTREELRGLTCVRTYGLIYSGLLNIQPLLTPGLRDGKVFVCKFPMTSALANDIVAGLMAAGKRLIQTHNTSGSVEAVLYEGEAAA